MTVPWPDDERWPSALENNVTSSSRLRQEGASAMRLSLNSYWRSAILRRSWANIVPPTTIDSLTATISIVENQFWSHDLRYTKPNKQHFRFPLLLSPVREIFTQNRDIQYVMRMNRNGEGVWIILLPLEIQKKGCWHACVGEISHLDNRPRMPDELRRRWSRTSGLLHAPFESMSSCRIFSWWTF